MGEVEEYRKAMSAGAPLDRVLPPARDAVERTLLRDVEMAWRNLTAYLARRRAEVER